MYAKTLLALASITALGGLVGCAMAPAVPPAESLKAARLACNEQYPAKVGNYLAHSICVNAAIERYALPTARYPDLVQLQGEIRLALSASVDRRRLSPVTGEVRMKEVDNAIAQIERDREAGNKGAADKRTAQLQALLK